MHFSAVVSPLYYFVAQHLVPVTTIVCGGCHGFSCSHGWLPYYNIVADSALTPISSPCNCFYVPMPFCIIYCSNGQQSISFMRKFLKPTIQVNNVFFGGGNTGQGLSCKSSLLLHSSLSAKVLWITMYSPQNQYDYLHFADLKKDEWFIISTLSCNESISTYDWLLQSNRGEPRWSDSQPEYSDLDQ